MSKPLAGRIPFAKILIVLALVFVISFGLCGLTAASVMRGAPVNSPVSKLLENAVPYELSGMLFSAAGLVVTTIAWVVVAAFGLGRERNGPEQLDKDKNDGDPKDPS